MGGASSSVDNYVLINGLGGSNPLFMHANVNSIVSIVNFKLDWK